ncbi:MAG: arsenate reductase family protein [Flavobacteriales bacterium]
MGTIAKDDQQLTIYFNSESTIGKQTHAYITASSKEIHAIDISKEKITGTQWAELADKLSVDLSDLIDTEHPKFKETYGEQDVALEEHDWIKILQGQPTVITWPIVVNGNQFIQIKNPSDVVKHIND